MGVPYVKGSETSKAAAESIKHVVGSTKVRIYQYMMQCGEHGATDDEIEVALGMSHQTASARRRNLEQIGACKKTSRKRPTRSGRAAAVYVAVADADLKATRGRPSKQQQKLKGIKATTYLTQDAYADLCMIAAEDDVSVADVIRKAIESHISARGQGSFFNQ